MFRFLAKTACIVAVGVLLAVGTARAQAPLLRWTQVAAHPHDSADFTQGLVWHDGRLFESTGRYGASRIAEKDLPSGRSLRATALPATQFGEGLTLLRGELWQLTWREGLVHVYDPQLRRLRSLPYAGEGWGLTSDGQRLLLSNGSDRLYWLDPTRLGPLGVLRVRDGARAVERLNELEWVGGVIYANVWLTDRVARIDATSGQVTGWLDFSALKRAAGITPAQERAGAVLNGIAWKADTQTLLVTGKWWTRVFELRVEGAP